MAVEPVILGTHATQKCELNAVQREAQNAALRRATALAEKYVSGKTLAEIGREYGISRGRVRQLIKKTGISAVDGGSHIRTAKKRAERVAALNERCMIQNGCCHEQWLKIPRKIRSQYQHKRYHTIAKYGAHAWAMTLPEYFAEVKQAGVELTRGGIGMTRIDKNHPFTPGNVEFKQIGSWMKDYHLTCKANSGC